MTQRLPLGTKLPGWGKIVGYLYIGEPYYFTVNGGVVGLCPVASAPEARSARRSRHKILPSLPTFPHQEAPCPKRK